MLGTVHPVNSGGLAELRHLLNPTQQILVCAERRGGAALFHMILGLPRA